MPPFGIVGHVTLLNLACALGQILGRLHVVQIALVLFSALSRPCVAGMRTYKTQVVCAAAALSQVPRGVMWLHISTHRCVARQAWPSLRAATRQAMRPLSRPLSRLLLLGKEQQR
eukprot:2069176-Pleurochrysis_carterae.AAC.1